MNAEKFSFYIKNPAHLYQITYTELKSLVLQYPYCQNLRYLLLKKSMLENHQELDQNLQLAATFSSDRNLLYQQMKEGPSFTSEADSFVLKEDYLELKELNPESAPKEFEVAEPEEAPAVIHEAEDNPLIEAPEPLQAVQPKVVMPEAPEEEEVITEKENSNSLDDIEEEEFIDITGEMDGLFEEEPQDFQAVNLQQEQIIEENDSSSESVSKEEETTANDDAISIEDLIRLDSLSPLERLEQTKSKEKEKEKHTEDILKEDHTEGMKKKSFDFSAIDALIEQTKKDVSLEITNEDFFNITGEPETKPSPKSSFGSWLKQIPDPEESNEEPKETFDLPDSITDSPEKKEKKEKKKKKKKDEEKPKNQEKKKKKKKKKKLANPKSDEIPEKAKHIAEKSLIENMGIVSETLANLLVKQENYKKAIKMYEKLSLIFPEKSSFFAEQIKKLKNL